MEKPSNEFLDTLGQYVYKYIDDEGSVLYIGKGRGNRCLWHLEDKGYKLEHCYIVARNLEAFENKVDWQSFLLESWLIATEKPFDNSVSGHYKECFVMTSLSSMFSGFIAEQHDNFESLPAWYTENYEQLRGRIRVFQISSSNVYLESNTRSQMNMKWYWVPNSDEPLKVMFEIYNQEDARLESTKAKLQEWIKKNGYKKITVEKKKLTIEVPCIEDTLALFSQFNA